MTLRNAVVMMGIANMALVTGAAAEVAEPPLTGNVLVWADAPLYLDASATSPRIRLASLDLGREHDVGYVLPMRIVATKGDYVEVEATTGVDCAWWRVVVPEGIADMRLYVKRTDLAPVLVKPFKAKHKDGSRIELQPGVAVLGEKLAFDNGVVLATVPAASIGVAYTPPKKIAAPGKRSKHPYLLDEKTDVTLGDKAFPFGPWVADTATKRGNRMLVTVAARCMTAVLSAPAARVHKDVAFGKGTVAPAPTTPAAATSHTGDRYFLPTGTKLTSKTGDHVVATLTADRDIRKPAAGAARACTDFVVRRDEVIVAAPHTRDAPQPERTLTLCAPTAAVKVEPRKRS